MNGLLKPHAFIQITWSGTKTFVVKMLMHPEASNAGYGGCFGDSVPMPKKSTKKSFCYFITFETACTCVFTFFFI